MLLSFLRHAEAEDEAPADFERRLTEKGFAQADKVGRFFARCGWTPDVILSSPVVRAEQTARAVAAHLGEPEIFVERWLSCGMSPAACLEELGAWREWESVMLVGHEPDFGEAIAACIGLENPGGLHIRKASMTAVRMPRLRAGAGRLEFCVPARLI